MARPMLSLLAQRWMEATVSVAVTGLPSENLRPLRRVNDPSVPSLEVLYFSTFIGNDLALQFRYYLIYYVIFIRRLFGRA